METKVDPRVVHILKSPPKSGRRFKGVVKTKSGYVARGSRNGVGLHIGHFKDEEEAARARDAWAVKEYGDWVYLNFPNDKVQ